tara:strand:- start:1571 stop:1771 length:201 start_codon:yes stop_codon:yes gene_type:complete
MIIFTLLGILTALFFFIIILMTVIEIAIKNKTNNKVFYKRDKVTTRTGGIAHDRNRSYNEIQNQKK